MFFLVRESPGNKALETPWPPRRPEDPLCDATRHELFLKRTWTVLAQGGRGPARHSRGSRATCRSAAALSSATVTLHSGPSNREERESCTRSAQIRKHSRSKIHTARTKHHAGIFQKQYNAASRTTSKQSIAAQRIAMSCVPPTRWPEACRNLGKTKFQAFQLYFEAG